MRRPIGLWLVLACLAGTLAVGYATKSACVDAAWTGQQYTSRCYTDIIPLYGTEQLTGSRLPYLDACEATTYQCDEYPVVTMYAMRVAAWASSTYADFFRVNVLLLALAAVLATVALYRMVGERALYLALAPTLALHAFTNWDLLAVAAATAATWAASRRRDLLAGVGIGVGVATKLYPGLLLLPFLAQRWREGDRRGAGRMAAGAALTWLALNLPFALLATDGTHLGIVNSDIVFEPCAAWQSQLPAILGEAVVGLQRFDTHALGEGAGHPDGSRTLDSTGIGPTPGLRTPHRGKAPGEALAEWNSRSMRSRNAWSTGLMPNSCSRHARAGNA